MSISHLTFVGTSPETFDEWQAAIDRVSPAARFDISGRVEDASGAISAKFEGSPIYLELYVEASANFPLLVEKVYPRNRVINFRWSSDASAGKFAYIASAALVHIFDGRSWSPIFCDFMTFESLMLFSEGRPLPNADPNRTELRRYKSARNSDGLYAACQRCEWLYETPKAEMLCNECAARCPVCDSYNRNCQRPGIFQIGSDPSYWRWVRDQHVACGEDLFWFQFIPP